MSTDSKVVATIRKPPNAGKGRVKGVPNKATASVKEAMLAVYSDLQATTGVENGHFKAWAEDNQTEFYKLWSKLIPVDVKADLTGNITINIKRYSDGGN